VVGALFVIALLAAPFFISRSALKDLFYVLTLVSLAQFWNLLAGYAGIISIGQQAYVGFGGYMLFALTTFAGLDPLAAVALAGLAGAAIAVPVARLVFRLNGPYLAVGTWVVSEVFRLGFAQMQSLGGGTGASLPTAVTNDAWSVRWVSSLFGLRAAVARDRIVYWLAVAFAVGTILLVYRLLRTRYGLALAAIRDNETAASSIGVDEARAKLWVYVVAGFGASLIGGLIFFQTARISPDAAFSVTDFTAYILFVVILGGIGTLEGPIVGVLALYVLRSELSDFGPIYLMLLGLVAILMMLFYPLGVWGELAQRFDIHLFPIRRRLIILAAADETVPTRTAMPAAQQEGLT
jgi:branched-chain amino acid transport system permease protein